MCIILGSTLCRELLTLPTSVEPLLPAGFCTCPSLFGCSFCHAWSLATVLIHHIHLVHSTHSLAMQNVCSESPPASLTQWHSTKLSEVNAWIIVSQNIRENWSWAPLGQCKLRLSSLMLWILPDKLFLHFTLIPFL